MNKFSFVQVLTYCLDILKEMVEKYPDWRFMQILSNTGIDEINFYEESVDTFNKIREI